MEGLSAVGLWEHTPLYHTALRNKDSLQPRQCPICAEGAGCWLRRARACAHAPAGRAPSLPPPPRSRAAVQRWPVHLHEKHGPPGHAVPPAACAPTWAFALVVVQRPSDGRFLVVQEVKSEGFWLPGGHVDEGESYEAAAVRECREEAGLDVELLGLLRVELTQLPRYSRQRAVFLARPRDPLQLPKSRPDFESQGVCWVSCEELRGLPLRGPEPSQYFQHVAAGGAVFPLGILAPEGSALSPDLRAPLTAAASPAAPAAAAS